MPQGKSLTWRNSSNPNEKKNKDLEESVELGQQGISTTTLKDESNEKTRRRPTTTLYLQVLYFLSVFRRTNNNNNNKMSFTKIVQEWKGAAECGKAQLQMMVVLAISYIGNNWPHSYPRNDNHNPTMFWVMNAVLAVAALASLATTPTTRNIQLLSRPQTEEWKGWMQWAFIMYHYYRMYAVYNEIRVFVSAYVWMTGFGNFLYFDKKQDFTIERAISMWIRINYFPILLSFAIDVPLDLYYVVPLHTAGFFITMLTCYLAKLMEGCTQWSANRRNVFAIVVCILVHVIFYETNVKEVLRFFSDEYFFRFQVDKYSAVVGIVSGFFWGRFKEYTNWCYSTNNGAEMTQQQKNCMWYQRGAGIALIGGWYFFFGSITDKQVHNTIHSYVFWMPVAGYLMLRNSSKYLTEVHSQALEFMGKITLETYVLQFHVFMCNKVQNIPIVIPGSGDGGDPTLRFLNMLLCGVCFVALAYWARQLTVSTQNTITELISELMGHARGDVPTANGGDVGMAPLKSGDAFARKQSDDGSIMAAAPLSEGLTKESA